MRNQAARRKVDPEQRRAPEDALVAVWWLFDNHDGDRGSAPRGAGWIGQSCVQPFATAGLTGSRRQGADNAAQRA